MFTGVPQELLHPYAPRTGVVSVQGTHGSVTFQVNNLSLLQEVQKATRYLPELKPLVSMFSNYNYDGGRSTTGCIPILQPSP
jgi:hypothetical protein